MELSHTVIANNSASEGLENQVIEAIKTVYDPRNPG